MSKEGGERPHEPSTPDAGVSPPKAPPLSSGKTGSTSAGASAARPARKQRRNPARVPVENAPVRRRRHGERIPRATQSYRFLRAYSTTLVVCVSYAWFSFVRRFYTASLAEEKIAELHVRNARRVETTIVLLQGLFIKVGQLMSIMANFLPEQFRSGLEALQDQVPPRPYAEIAERIEEELGRPANAIFTRFIESPLASASLGQVHEAWLTDGSD